MSQLFNWGGLPFPLRCDIIALVTKDGKTQNTILASITGWHHIRAFSRMQKVSQEFRRLKCGLQNWLLVPPMACQLPWSHQPPRSLYMYVDEPWVHFEYVKRSRMSFKYRFHQYEDWRKRFGAEIAIRFIITTNPTYEGGGGLRAVPN